MAVIAYSCGACKLSISKIGGLERVFLSLQTMLRRVARRVRSINSCSVRVKGLNIHEPSQETLSNNYPPSPPVLISEKNGKNNEAIHSLENPRPLAHFKFNSSNLILSFR
jgi:hypothetical protein